MTTKIETTSLNYSTTLDPQKRAQEFYERALALLDESDCEKIGQDMGKAVVYLKEAIELDPTYAGFYIHMGAIQFIQSDPEAAIKTLSNAIQMNPAFSDQHTDRGLAQYLRGLAQVMQGHKQSLEAALLDFEAAVDLGFGAAQNAADIAREILRKIDTHPEESGSLQSTLMETASTHLKTS